jgi:hypothetical protein
LVQIWDAVTRPGGRFLIEDHEDGLGRLAQLVEHLVYTERVGSSSLSSPTTHPAVCKNYPASFRYPAPIAAGWESKTGKMIKVATATFFNADRRPGNGLSTKVGIAKFPRISAANLQISIIFHECRPRP